MHRALPAAVAALGLTACAAEAPEGTLITFPMSALGREADVLEGQIARFESENPGIRVERRRTPDAADQRHQLFVQWLNARAPDPDVLQLDVVWSAEFAAAGWILPLDRFEPDLADFFKSTLEANRWRGTLYALPWFVDAGMLYYRTDLVEAPPASFEELAGQASSAVGAGKARYGFLWQGARYEGLICNFLEHLGGFGGRILDDAGRVVVDSEEAVSALAFMREAIVARRFVPESVLTWQEEQTRFGFQNGDAVFLRNWPYAYALMADPQVSKVAGRFAVAPLPAGPGGAPTSTLGGSQLAINAETEHPEAAWAVIEYLTRPEQMIERARVVGQYPPRPSLYETEALAEALGSIDLAAVRAIVERAAPRPVTPVYSELSEILQIWLHRALTGQIEPRPALQKAAAEMRRLLERVGLEPAAAGSEA